MKTYQNLLFIHINTSCGENIENIFSELQCLSYKYNFCVHQKFEKDLYSKNDKTIDDIVNFINEFNIGFIFWMNLDFMLFNSIKKIKPNIKYIYFNFYEKSFHEKENILSLEYIDILFDKKPSMIPLLSSINASNYYIISTKLLSSNKNDSNEIAIIICDIFINYTIDELIDVQNEIQNICDEKNNEKIKIFGDDKFIEYDLLGKYSHLYYDVYDDTVDYSSIYKEIFIINFRKDEKSFQEFSKYTFYNSPKINGKFITHEDFINIIIETIIK
jgi:hypothetical protein